MRRRIKLWCGLTFIRCHHPEVVSANLFRKMIVIFNNRKSLQKPLRYFDTLLIEGRWNLWRGEIMRNLYLGKVKIYPIWEGIQVRSTKNVGVFPRPVWKNICLKPLASQGTFFLYTIDCKFRLKASLNLFRIENRTFPSKIRLNKSILSFHRKKYF